MTLANTITHLDHFQHRVVQDALKDAHPGYWLHRARIFEAARPRPGDYTGRATREDIAAIDQRCRESADACRARAAVHRERVVA